MTLEGERTTTLGGVSLGSRSVRPRRLVRRSRSPVRRGCRAVLAAVSVLLLAVSCGSPVALADGTDGLAAEGRKKVLTTFTVLADMTRNVAGDRLDVASITKPGVEIHQYEVTPGDLKRTQGVDLILRNGLGLEQWFDRFIEQADARSVDVSVGIEPIAIVTGEHEGAPNPHAWMSPANAEVYIRNIARALSDLDPEHADEYEANADAYLGRVREVGRYLRDELAHLPDRQRALVTCEGAFSYLARDVGLREAYIWPVNAETEGTPQQVAEVVAFVRENRIPAVFCESTVNDKAQRQVAKETGAQLVGPLYVDSLSGPDGPVPTYLDLLRHTAETIVGGLARGGERS